MSDETDARLLSSMYEASYRNTSPDWLGPATPVEVELEDMGQFADNLVGIREFLFDHASYLRPMATLSIKAWDPWALPEGVWMMRQMATNYAELEFFINDLWQGVWNIGMAAQTIADLYASTDGLGAASVNDVKWAFGASDAVTPANLPPWLASGVTIREAMRNPELVGGDPLPPPPVPREQVDWGPAQQSWYDLPNGTAMVTTTFLGPNGERKVITTHYDAHGTVVEYTTEYASDGTVVDSAMVQTVTTMTGNATTVTTTTEVNGRPQGSEVLEVTADGTWETLTTFDPAGNPTGSTEIRPGDNGTLVTTTYDKDHNAVGEITVGEQTTGAGVGTEDPVDDAMQEVAQLQLGIQQ